MPFGGSASNPSQHVAERLDGKVTGGARVVSLVLPVVMDGFEQVAAAIDAHTPALVLSLGLAAGTPCLDIERFAVNLRVTAPGDPALPQSKIDAGGPDALFAAIHAERCATPRSD